MLGTLSPINRGILYVIAVLVLALFLVGFLYREEVKAGAVKSNQISILEQAQARQTAAIRKMIAQDKRNQEILAARERARARLQRELSLVRLKIAQLGDRDAEAKTWLTSPVPLSILDLVHQNGGGD